MKLKLRFTKTDWLAILRQVRLEKTDPESADFSPSYKKEIIATNVEKDIFVNFIAELKESKNTDKTILIDIPETKNGLIARTIMSIVKAPKSKDIYYNLLKVNNQPNYQKLVWDASPEYQRDRVKIFVNYDSNDPELFRIMQHAIMLSPPSEVQSAFEYFKEQLEELDTIDSKAEEKEARSRILSDYHKAMRQTDMFGDGHTCMIIYNLWAISDIVIRVMTAVIDHVKETEAAHK